MCEMFFHGASVGIMVVGGDMARHIVDDGNHFAAANSYEIGTFNSLNVSLRNIS